MESKIVDMTSEAVAERVLTAYYLLYSDDLRCIEQVTTPSLEFLRQENVFVVLCEDDGEDVGVLCVDSGSVLYPVMVEDRRYIEILTSMISCARERRPLFAETENQIILETAVAMDIGVERHGNRLEFN